MRLGGGKQKGASFEREVCKRLSLWLSKGLQEDVLWRSAMSGGRSTVAAERGKRLQTQSGDAACQHPCGYAFAARYFIEMKAYKDLQFEGLLTGKGHLVNFWKTACAEAKKYDKSPLLVGKQNQQPIFVGMNSDGYFQLSLLGMAALEVKPLDLYILLFDDFLKYAKCDG